MHSSPWNTPPLLPGLPEHEEMALIERLLGDAPSRRVLDLGCGAGRHARWLAERDCTVVGIDASEAAVARAQAETASDSTEFLIGDMGAVEGAVRGQFGCAVCLGNTLPYLLTPESLSRMLIGLRRRLLPGAPLVIQLLNYDRILADSARNLPLEFLPSSDGELIVLRLLEPRDDGIVLHTTSTLRHQPSANPVLEVVGSHQTQLRAWTLEELDIMLEVARLPRREVYGDLAGKAYEPDASLEFVAVAG